MCSEPLAVSGGVSIEKTSARGLVRSNLYYTLLIPPARPLVLDAVQRGLVRHEICGAGCVIHARDHTPHRAPHRVERMQMRVLGRTGVKVSPLCLGAMMFGGWGNTDHDESVRIIHRALDAGVNFIDTADVYSAGESEEITGKALAGGRRDGVVLATKAHGQMGDDVNASGNSRRWLIAECENSLRRLGTDYIDLYQIHRPDPDADIDETLGALTDLVRAGKIRYAGSSTFPPSQIVEAQWVAERRGRERFVCEQPPYSVLVRGVEAEVLPVCQRYGMGVIPWSPLAGGWLTGRYRKGTEVPVSRRAERIPHRYDLSLPGNQVKLEAAEQLALLAEQAGMSLIHLALAFVLSHPAVTSAIIGPRTMEHLDSQLGAADVVLSADVLDRIDQIVAPGTNLNQADGGYAPPSVTDPALRRR
jgi:aryl-alcohol dehydrogenase-like predicted oxidoreductase